MEDLMPKMPPKDPVATKKISDVFKDGLEKGSADPVKHSATRQAKLNKIKPVVKSAKPTKKSTKESEDMSAVIAVLRDALKNE